ncbi:MAG TPA: 4-hydroxythreonine-4-phosphate dehydrogenase PdxA, partial [Vicinamibacterales bacterium]
MRRPRVAITAGDPAGIGPEIAARAAADPRVTQACDPIVFAPEPGQVFPAGQLSADAGRAAYDTILRAVDAAKRGEVDAIATAPVNKEAFVLAGLPWAGHTDLLAHLTGASHVAMMFHSEPLRVVLATVHVALADVPRLLTQSLM